MHWDRLFEDLEGQLASEWEAERAARDAESERLRISRIGLRARLGRLCAADAVATIDLPGGVRVRARLLTLGADWLAAAVSEDGARPSGRTIRIIPLASLRGLGTDHGLLLSSLDDGPDAASPLRERMTLGFVLRDLARRRAPVRVETLGGDHHHGTIDRAGADHLDLALHDAGEARRASAVRGFRIVPFSALAWIEAAADQLP